MLKSALKSSKQGSFWLAQSAPSSDAGHAFLGEVLARALRQPDCIAITERIRETCAVRFRDVIDHIGAPFGQLSHMKAGWEQAGPGLWRHASRDLPPVMERPQEALALRVSSVEGLATSLRIGAPIHGVSHAPYRHVRMGGEDVELVAVERRRAHSEDAAKASERQIRRARVHHQSLRTRRRAFRNSEAGLSQTGRLLKSIVADLGRDWACTLFIASEIEFWERHCIAGAVQGQRQTHAGIGWSNVDHLLYCTSREHLFDAIQIFALLDYELAHIERTPSHASGASLVLQNTQPHHPNVTLFFDLDPREEAELSAGALPPLTWLHQSGVWCALHGESLLEGGPCLIAARYDCTRFAKIMRTDGFTYACDTAAQRPYCLVLDRPRAVNPIRVDVLQRDGHLNLRQAEPLRLDGHIAAYLLGIEHSHTAPAVNYADLLWPISFEGRAQRDSTRPRVRMKARKPSRDASKQDRT